MTGETAAALMIIRAVADAVRDLGQVPEGELYAAIMGHLSLDAFNRVLEILKRGGMIQVRGHLVIWTGPDQKDLTPGTVPN